MDDKEKERLSLALYDVAWNIKNTLSLPVHDTLYKSLLFSLLLFGVSLVGSLGRFYTFISWQGALLCSIVLAVLLWVERAQNNAYEVAMKKARKAYLRAKKKAQELSNKGGETEDEVSGVSDDDTIPPEQAGGGFEETSSG